MLADLRQALRLFRQQPLASGIVIAVLALGTGANTAIFSVVNTVLLQPLPFREADRLVMVWGFHSPDAGGIRPVSVPTFREWKTRNAVFEQIAASSDAVGGRHSSRAPDAHGRGGIHSADHVREPREPAARARERTLERDGHSKRARLARASFVN